ncbi:hypothetical protein EIL87_08720 [Saccharopolyspora rhizosphaerae]|uniref:Uncharacterized protein n=1 Tax=Saccharopolyspora rhizosphaerae TaxID=2492662 RepID=A0A426JYR9_9PSEU|nr:hypothetical protein [Saccharopolyspora rhizosphaerae]RRO18304.1 hypothetical protein EIL87_08720 [Saccharopolyspora rhizosphaerae]
MRAMRKSRRPHEVVASAPPDRLVGALVDQLAATVGGHAAYCLPAADRPDDVEVVASSANCIHSGLERSSTREPVRGGRVLLVWGARRWGEEERTALRETAGWLAVTGDVDRMRSERDRAEERFRSLRADVTAARERLAHVRDLERRRLVRAITTSTLRDLDELRRRLRGVGERLAEDGEQERIAALGAVVDDMLETFRAVVRGVYPAMLPDKGPRFALEELAATLPHPVRFSGDLGRRVGWQVESGFYHAVAAVLNLLAGEGIHRDDDPAVEVEFARDEVLRARVRSTVGDLSAGDLRAALHQDAERIAVLGGAVECTVVDGTAVVSVRLADRTTSVTTSHGESSALFQRVSDLVKQGQHAAEAGPARARWDAIAARLVTPPRLAVVADADGPGPAEVDSASLLGVTVVFAGGPADLAVAEELLADDGPRGSVDAVLCRVAPTPEFRAALRRSPQRVELSETTCLDRLARRLVTWAPVIAARRALVSARALLPGLPVDHPLRWAVDRIAAEAHEITELDLLDELLSGETRVLRGVAEDAARLLGAEGADPRSRLGLEPEVNDEQVRVAAQRAACRWRAHAVRPTTSGRDASVCEVLVRTAEGLLSEGRNP